MKEEFSIQPPRFMVDSSEVDQPASSKLRIQKFCFFLAYYWWIPVVTLLLGLVIGVIQVMRQPATFFSEGRLWETMKLQPPGGAIFNENAEEAAGTQNELLRSSLIRNRAMTRLGAASNNVVIPLNSRGEPLPVTIRVLQSSKSAIFTLDATGPEPAYTQAYLQVLMEAYLDYMEEIRKQISGDTLASLSAQVKLAEQNLKMQQDTQAEFERTNNVAVLQEEANVAGSYLTRLKTQLSDLKSDERLMEKSSAALAETENSLDPTNQIVPELAALTALQGPEVADLAEKMQAKMIQLEILERQREALGQNLIDQAPEMQKLSSDIKQAGMELDVYRRQSRERLAAAADNAQQRIENIENSINKWGVKQVEVNSYIADADRLKNNMIRAQGDYDRLSALIQNFKISRDFDQQTLAILEDASPAIRIYSELKRTMTSSLLGGLMIGLGCVALLAIRDEKFGSIMEVREHLRHDVIGQVPEWPGANGKLRLTAAVDRPHVYAESFRSLRSALLFLNGEGKCPQMILITSAVPAEGKSTVAANLAHTLALGGAQVLLVDGDLRRGTLHQMLHLKQEPGLSELLERPAETDLIIQSNELPNFSFISAGGLVANPGDRMMGTALDQLLSDWRSRFDHILIDSSPIFAADDATILATKVDGTILVVRRRFSKTSQVQGALETLSNRRAKLLGVVFNRADASSGSYEQYKFAEYNSVTDMAGS